MVCFKLVDLKRLGVVGIMRAEAEGPVPWNTFMFWDSGLACRFRLPAQFSEHSMREVAAAAGDVNRLLASLCRHPHAYSVLRRVTLRSYPRQDPQGESVRALVT